MMPEEPPILDYRHGGEPSKASVNWKRVIVFAIVGILALVIYLPFSPSAIQKQNMELARLHIPIVISKTTGDPRFDHIRFSEFTALGGSLIVRGGVRSDPDLQALKALVASTSPPVQVFWSVQVVSEEELDYLYFDITSSTKATP